jgi:hypothetical protein
VRFPISRAKTSGLGPTRISGPFLALVPIAAEGTNVGNRSFKARLREWWEGTPLDLNKPGGNLIVIGDHREFHWTARASRAALEYCREHHRWVIGTVIAIAALVLAKVR